MGSFDIFEITVYCSDEEYKLKFSEKSQSDYFLENYQDDEYIRAFLPGLPYGKEVYACQTALISSTSGNKMDFYADPYVNPVDNVNFKMANPIAGHQAEVYECEHCDKLFTCSKSLSRHMKEVNTDSRIICIVPSCHSTFARTDSYRHHLTHIHRRDFKLTDDNWTSSTKTILRLMKEEIELTSSVKKIYKKDSKPSQAARGNGGENVTGNSISQIAPAATTRSNAILCLKRTFDAPEHKLRIQENRNAPLATTSINAETVQRRVKVHLPTVRKLSGMTKPKIEANDSGKKDDDAPQRLTKKRKIQLPIANIQDIAESHPRFTASSTNSEAQRLKWVVPVKKFHIPTFETKGDYVNKGELRDYFVGMAQMFSNVNETVKVIRKEVAIEMKIDTVSATTTAEKLPSSTQCPPVSMQVYHDHDDNVHLPSTPRSLEVSPGDYDDDDDDDEWIDDDDNVHLDLFSWYTDDCE